IQLGMSGQTHGFALHHQLPAGLERSSTGVGESAGVRFATSGIGSPGRSVLLHFANRQFDPISCSTQRCRLLGPEIVLDQDVEGCLTAFSSISRSIPNSPDVADVPEEPLPVHPLLLPESFEY
ncbi:MAG: hypothetical protein AAF211_07625, partial [Myxococcota bacterium]